MDLSPAIKHVIATAETANPIEPGDYKGEDGMYYCGKCHTPKQIRCNFGGLLGERIVFAMCDCQKKQKELEAEERRRVNFMERVKDLRRKAFPEDGELAKYTFANDDGSNPKITEVMKNYIANFATFYETGTGLLLYGGCGTGKTFAACEVANALIDKGHPVLATNIAKILNPPSPWSAQSLNFIPTSTYDRMPHMDTLSKYRLLIIDDLGAERDTSYAKEQVYNVIDSRYRTGLPMIITTNMSIEELKKPRDIASVRIYDRILERCFPVEVNGKSHRRKAIIENYADTKEKLGL